MPSQSSLSSADREFFQWVAGAAFANPFSEQRLDLDRKIIGAPFKNETERGEYLKRSVSDRVRKLTSPGRADLRAYAGVDREMMRHVFLFEIYHQFFERLDEHIDAQVKAGDTLVRVAFAGEALALLGRRGFAADEARRFFGIFFQLRRAFYFILQGLLGESDCMKAFRRHLWDNVFTHDIRWYDRYLWSRMEDFSTLLLGETGTGKGTAAAAIGRSGFIPFEERKGCFAESFTRSFIALNLSQYPEMLIESELFGHQKGAFTGAVEAHEGVFARCSPCGAIFLDEIGDVSTPVQIKLLQVLQERTFSPVGSHEKLRFRGRVIAATNRSLDALRDQKVFRDDFFYRLCSDVLTVPPLRQRLRETPAELEFLVRHLVTRMTGAPAMELVALVMDVLKNGVGAHYAWPGNVRELEQAVRRILLTRRYQGDTRGVAPDLRGRLAAELDRGTLDADTLLAGYCALLFERHNTIEEVARRTNLDRRTVKRYLAMRTPGEGRSKGKG
jgi:transcriptional regulator with AAA-type ATPase domain